MANDARPLARPAKGGERSFFPTRRGFLVGGGIGAGLVIGYMLWPRRYPNGFAAPDGADEVALSPWIRISEEGRVTVAVPQAEMGQGVWSAFAQIVADELGADWRRMTVEPAPYQPVYANTGLADEAAARFPMLFRGLAASLGEALAERLNLNLTAGSNSIRSYHDKLRLAAAEARQRLIAAVAKEWGASPKLLDTKDGFVFYQQNRMAFGAAVRLVDPRHEPPAPELRAAGAGGLAGKALPRLDLPPKVDGSARYGGDVRLPGMVYAAIRHGPIGGRLVKASAPAGVALVEGPNWVATAARTTFEAQQQLEKIEADFAIDGEEAGPAIAADLAGKLGKNGKLIAEHGDVERAFAAAGGGIVTADYQLPFLAHAALEPMVATARILEGQVEIWGPTQSLTVAHRQLAQALSLSSDLIRIYPTLVGGGFGRNIEADAMVEAALIARALDKPVQLCWTREEEFGADCFRPPAAARLRAVAGDHRIAAFEARVAAPALQASFLARSWPRLAPSPGRGSASDLDGLTALPYDVAALKLAHAPVTQPVPIGYWRSVAHSYTCFMLESFIDELALREKADPLQFRLDLLGGKPRHQHVLQAAATAAGWDDPAPQGMARGIAISEAFGSLVAVVVTAGVAAGAIRIAEVASAIDCGPVIAPDSVRQQLEGGAAMGLSAALYEEMAFDGGEALARNFDQYRLARMADLPSRFLTVLVDSKAPLGGVGEAGLPPAAPALANALARATGKRARRLPLAQFYGAA